MDKSDNYLYKNFRLVSVNTARDLRKRANPFVSAAVLIGGLAIAFILLFTYSYTKDVESVIAGSMYDIESYD